MTLLSGVVTVSRIKPHTDYRGKYESGIVKMTVIGLGKREGASQHHRWGWKGLQQMMVVSMEVILEKTKFLGGLAILENANEETAELRVVDRAKLLETEPVLLEKSRDLMGKLPFDELDVLVIGEIGKNYSGAGIDPNAIAFAHHCEWTTNEGFWRDITDAHPPRRARKAPICDERHLLAHALPIDQRSDSEHLAHARTADRAFIANHENVAG